MSGVRTVAHLVESHANANEPSRVIPPDFLHCEAVAGSDEGKKEQGKGLTNHEVRQSDHGLQRHPPERHLADFPRVVVLAATNEGLHLPALLPRQLCECSTCLLTALSDGDEERSTRRLVVGDGDSQEGLR